MDRRTLNFQEVADYLDPPDHVGVGRPSEQAMRQVGRWLHDAFGTSVDCGDPVWTSGDSDEEGR